MLCTQLLERTLQTSTFINRNYKDLESLLDELSAIAPKKTLMEMYNLATEEAYSFWYINLMAKSKSDMFFIRFEEKMSIQ